MTEINLETLTEYNIPCELLPLKENRSSFDLNLSNVPQGKPEIEQRSMHNFPSKKVASTPIESKENKFSMENSIRAREMQSFNKRKVNARSSGCELLNFLTSFSTVFQVYRYIKDRAFYRSYKNLQEHHLKCINDSSIILQYTQFFRDSKFKRKKFLRDCWGKTSKALADLPMLDPNNLIKVIWDLLVFSFLLLQLITYSLERSFDNKIFSLDLHGLFMTVTFIIVFLDILLIFNTKIFISGTPIKNRAAILKHYLNYYFLIDFLTLVCLILTQAFNSENEKSDLKLVFILKIIFCNQELSSRIRQMILKLGNTAETIYDLITLGASILLAGHTIACLWHFIGFDYIRKNPTGNCWLKSRGILEEGWKTKYLHSIYWSITTMLSVGYGDITPQNENEILFTLVAMVYGCVVFGYSLSSVGEILERRNKSANIHAKNREKANIIRIMARDMNLSFELETKILRYMDYYWEQEKRVDPIQENLILSQLSSSLREQICWETNVKYLSAIPLFRKILSEKTLIELAHRLKKVRCPPEEIIYKDQSTDTNLYILLDGRVEAFSSEAENPLSQSTVTWEKYSVRTIYSDADALTGKYYFFVKKSDYFGIMEFITGFKRRGGAVSKDFSTMFILTKEDFLSAISHSSLEYEKYCKIRDDLILYRHQYVFEIRCASCGKFDHSTLDCRFLKYTPSKLLVVAKYQNRWKNFRKTFVRENSRLKTNSLKNFGVLNQTVNDFCKRRLELRDSKSVSKLLNEAETLSSVSEQSVDSKEMERNTRIPINNTYQTERRTSILDTNRGSPYYSEERRLSIEYLESKLQNLRNLSPRANKSTAPASFKQRKSIDSGIRSRHMSVMQNCFKDYTSKLLLFLPLDKMKSYKFYFPLFNSEKVIFKMRVRRRLKSIRRLHNDC